MEQCALQTLSIQLSVPSITTKIRWLRQLVFLARQDISQMLVMNFASLSQQVFRETQILPPLKLLQDAQNPITVTGALPSV